MGIDLIRGGRIANRGFRKTKSSNAYLKTLIKVVSFQLSYTVFLLEELMPNSIRLSIKDSINQGLTDTQSQSQELLGTSKTINFPFLKEKINIMQELLLLSELLLMMLDFWMSLKDSESLLLNSLLKLKQEFTQLKDKPSLLTN